MLPGKFGWAGSIYNGVIKMGMTFDDEMVRKAMQQNVVTVEGKPQWYTVRGRVRGIAGKIRDIDVFVIPVEIDGKSSIWTTAIGKEGIAELEAKISDVRKGKTTEATSSVKFVKINEEIKDIVKTKAGFDAVERVKREGEGDKWPSAPYCFIATAAYGTPMAEEINVLREFRDFSLRPKALGRALVGTYYKVSPPIATVVSMSSGLRKVVRGLLCPFVKRD